MKNGFLLVMIIGIFSCAEKKPAEKEESNQINYNTKQIPQIEFDTEMHDFGKLKSGEVLVYTFVFTNTGKADLIINKADTDCGCLKSKVANERVKPGEKGIIEIEFDTSGMYGKQLKTIEIQSNSKEPKHLIIFADVENEQIEIKN